MYGGISMKVIRIIGENQDTEIIRSNLQGISKGNLIFILDEDKQLYEFIENLEIDDNILYNLNITNEIDFSNISAELNDKFTDETVLKNITSLSNLLEKTSVDDIRRCRLVLDTEDNDLISKVTQALIYLDLELEVTMKKDKKDRLKLNALRKKFERIINVAANGEKELQNLETGDEYIIEKKNYINTFHEIEKELEQARDREFNISVISNKKAGKSVLVNSLLKEQYAPTSMELPTPNNCIYKKNGDNNIRLLYGKKDILFKNPKEIYDYIYNEYKNAQNDKANEYQIDDMEIYFNTVNDIASFTVIDTQGSYYVSDKSIDCGENMHKKFVNKWIEKSDVVLCLINYYNYLEGDDDEFFKNIKLQFEKLDKFYSLIIVVNKLDEMYKSECENKSVVRFLDYIRHKLYEIGYKGFIVIGTSARTYFDIIKISRIDSDISNSQENFVPIENLKGADLRARVKSLKNRFVGKLEMSSLSFVDEQLENLECFYGLRDYNLDTLRQKSGIPELEKYTTNVAMQKANDEVFRKLIKDIDEKFVKVSNENIINKLITSKNENIANIQGIEPMIRNIMDRYNIIKADLETKLSFEEFQDSLFNELKISMDGILKHMMDIGEARADEFFMKLLLKTSDELNSIKNKTTDIKFSINRKVFMDQLNDTMENSVNLLNSEINARENYVIEAEAKMREIIENFSEKIRKEYYFNEFYITMPQINKEFNTNLTNLLLNIPAMDINDDNIKEKIRDSIEFNQTSVQGLLNNFKRDRAGTYFLNSAKLRKINLDYIEYLRNGEYDKYYNLLKENLSLRMEEHKKDIIQVIKSISEVYKNIFNDMLKSLAIIKLKSEKQIRIMDSNLEFYKSVDEKIKYFAEEWDTVRNAGK
jgi:hypothetical protein